MSEIKPNDSSPTEDSGEENDWAAAKAFFDNLKTHKPRPVRILVERLFALSLSVGGTRSLSLPNKPCVVVPVMFLCCFLCFHHLSIPSQPKPRYAVTIAVSSRTLFDMVAERKIYEEEGVEKYVAHQVEHENEPLKPGAAFPFVKVGPSPLC